MKISAQEEYGLRILVRIGQSPDAFTTGLSIPEISEAEGLTIHNVAKLCRMLRMAGFIHSTRGKEGGYTLAKPPEKIIVGEVVAALGGRLFDEEFCGNHTGITNLCTNSIDCSLRSLWQIVQHSVDNVLNNITLAALIGPARKLETLKVTRIQRQPALPS